MKSTQYRPIVLGNSDIERQREVQHEIENFLHAVSSYPDRFAREPYLTFEQHLFSIVASESRISGHQ